MDNLNTHAVSSLYKAFPAGETLRIEDMGKLCQELAAKKCDHNDYASNTQWQFTVDKARSKLISLYPKLKAPVSH